MLCASVLSLVFFVALAAGQCVISFTVEGITNEVYPGFVHAPSGTDFDIRLRPSIVSGGATCASSGFSVAVQWENTDLAITPGPAGQPVVAGFSGSCTPTVASVVGATGTQTKKRGVTYQGCSSTSQIGSVTLRLRMKTQNAGFTSSVNFFSPCASTTFPCSAGAQTHTTKILWLPTGSATVIGDPKISGFYNQEFEFGGKVGKVYHVYSDHYVSVNALFAAANPFDSSVKGTVMDSMFVRFGDKHTLEFSAWSVNNTTKEVSVKVDGTSTLVLPADDSRHKLTGCSWLSWEGKHLLLGQGEFDHVVVFTIQSRNKKHLNTSYVNVELNLALPDAAAAGGLIGWTAEKHPVLRTYHDSSRVLISAPPEADYITSSFMALDAKTNKYQAMNYPCPKNI